MANAAFLRIVFFMVALSAGLLGGAAVAQTPEHVEIETAQPSVAPLSPAARAAAVDAALQGERLAEAQALLDDMSSPHEDGQADNFLLLRAELLLASGRATDAKKLLESIEPNGPRNCRQISAMAIADMQTDNDVVALEWLAADSDLCSEEPIFWRALGLARLKRGEAAAALDALRKAHILRSGDKGIANDLAVTLIANGNIDEASNLLTRILHADPANVSARINLDFAQGILGHAPSRHGGDSDQFWSERLQAAGDGAQSADNPGLAAALFAQALVASPTHDGKLWAQYRKVTLGK